MNLMTPAILSNLRELILSDDVIKFYHTKEWKKLRSIVLKRDHYECRVCALQGRHTRANTVHHIKHLKEHPECALLSTNLEVICKKHHNQEHPEKLAGFVKHKFTNEERW